MVPRAQASLPLTNVMPLLHRALEVMARREVQPQLGLLKSTMLQLDSSFTERDYSASSFRLFVEMLAKARLVEINKVSGHYLVEIPKHEEAAKPETAPLNREDALRAVHKALRIIDENDLWGRLDFDAVKEYVQRVVPDFDEKRYGFGQFAEVLNYAQDLGLVRLEPDADSVLRVKPGTAFTHARSGSAPAAAVASAFAPRSHTHAPSVFDPAAAGGQEPVAASLPEEMEAVASADPSAEELGAEMMEAPSLGAAEETAAPASGRAAAKPKRAPSRPRSRGGARRGSRGSGSSRKTPPTKS